MKTCYIIIIVVVITRVSPHFARDPASKHISNLHHFRLNKVYYYSKSHIFQEYEEPVYAYSTYPVRRSPRDIHNIFKMSPPFASSEGVSFSGDRYQSDDACRTQPQRHCLLSRCRVRMCCSIALTFSFSFCFFLPYLSLFSFSFHPKSDISAL